MAIIEGTSLWDYYAVDGYTICIPTNGSIDSNGCAVMGAGVALEAKKRIPGISRELAIMIRRFGNDVFALDELRVRSFPTKHTWRDEKADPKLIAHSAWCIFSEARGDPETTFVLPAWPGCGCGKLKVEEVKKLFEGAPPNVWIACQEQE